MAHPCFKSIVTILERVLVAHLNLIDLKVYCHSWNLVQMCFGNCSLERSWYQTHTLWTCKTIIVLIWLNIPRKIIYFHEQLKKTPFIQNWHIELNYLLILHCSWSVVPLTNIHKRQERSVRVWFNKELASTRVLKY